MLHLLVFFAGSLLAVQAAVNASLARNLGHQPLLATFISFVVGTVALLALILWRSDLSALGQLPQQALWRFSGGLLGVVFVFSVVFATPKIGVAGTLMLVMLGQLCMAALIDQRGWLEVPLRPLESHHYWGLALAALGLALYFQGHRLR